MTKRERLERKLEKRQDWAAKADAKCSAEFEAARKITEGIPFGQPILVGHHSEGMHRRAIERSAGHMDKGCEAYNKAKYHASKAEGLSRMLDNTIFSDDEDAVEKLEQKIAQREKEQETYKAFNKVIRNKKMTEAEKVSELVRLGMSEAGAKERVEKNAQIPSYAMTNNNSEIRRLKERVATIKARQEKTAKAEANPHGVFVETGTLMCNVTFAEKPDWTIIKALKDAGYYYHNGTWRGYKEKLPECIRVLIADERGAEA